MLWGSFFVIVGKIKNKLMIVGNINNRIKGDIDVKKNSVFYLV